MNNAELYMEFNEKCTDGLIVDRNEFSKRLKKMKKGTIIEQIDGKYQIYYPLEAGEKQEHTQNGLLELRIDPAARIRFEGSLKDYEDLLKEIKKIGVGICNFKVYCRLREGDADSEFFIADVYYLMQ